MIAKANLGHFHLVVEEIHWVTANMRDVLMARVNCVYLPALVTAPDRLRQALNEMESGSRACQRIMPALLSERGGPFVMRYTFGLRGGLPMLEPQSGVS